MRHDTFLHNVALPHCLPAGAVPSQVVQGSAFVSRQFAAGIVGPQHQRLAVPQDVLRQVDLNAVELRARLGDQACPRNRLQNRVALGGRERGRHTLVAEQREERPLACHLGTEAVDDADLALAVCAYQRMR